MSKFQFSHDPRNGNRAARRRAMPKMNNRGNPIGMGKHAGNKDGQIIVRLGHWEPKRLKIRGVPK